MSNYEKSSNNEGQKTVSDNDASSSPSTEEILELLEKKNKKKKSFLYQFKKIFVKAK